MDEEMTGLFRCRNCGAVFEEKVDVARSVSWAIKDITENLGGGRHYKRVSQNVSS